MADSIATETSPGLNNWQQVLLSVFVVVAPLLVSALVLVFV